MDVSTSNFWHAKQSQIYTTLKKLEKDKLVVSHVEPQEGRPDRRIYTITAAGKVALDKWLAQPLMEVEPRKEQLLLKLFFSAPLDKQTLLMNLRLQEKLHKENLEKYQTTIKAVVQQFAASTDMVEDAQLWEATRRFGEMYEEMFLSWLAETIAVLERRE
jgi:PadR family transcriptional regulator AphA